MIGKKLILIGFFLFLGLIIGVNAQEITCDNLVTSGCCINLDENAGSDYVCQDTILRPGASSAVPMTKNDCSFGCFYDETEYDFYSTSCANLPGQLCEYACHVCLVDDTTDPDTTTNFWRYKAETPCVDDEYLPLYYDTARTEANCELGAPSPPITNPAFVSGVVKDGVNTVQGASISCSIQPSTGILPITRADGSYGPIDCKADLETVTATFGQKTGSKTQVLTAGQSNTVNIALAEAATGAVTVNVFDENNQPLVADKISLTATGYTGLETQTDIAQFYQVPLGEIRLVTEKSGYKTNFTEERLIAGKIYNIKLEPTPTITLSGTVTDKDSEEPIPNATIKVYHLVGGAEIPDASPAKTDSNGDYSMEVSVADYTLYLRAEKQGYDPFSISPFIITEADKDLGTKTQDIELQLAGQILPSTSTFTIRVVIKDTDTGIGGAYVELLNADYQYNADGHTNNAGNLIGISLYDNKVYTIHAAHMDYLDYWGEISIPSSIASGKITVELTPLPQLIVRGRVIKAGNGAISGATVSLLGKSYATGTGLNVGKFEFTIKVPDDALTLYARAEKYIKNTAVIPAGITAESYNLGDIELTPSECTADLGQVVLQDIIFEDGAMVLEEWDTTCTPNSFIVKRKIEGIDGAYRQIISSQSPNLQYSYIDNIGLEPGKLHCYIVDAVYDFPLPRGTVTLHSTPKCKMLGPEECLNGDITFCDGNQIMECENGEFKTPIPCGTQICMEQSSASAECVDQRRCDLCNRPFGVFSQQVSGSLFGGKGSEETLFVFKSAWEGYFSCEQRDEPCYLDYSNTIVDKYYECTDEDGNALVTSCYDYASKKACQDENKCLASQECEWIDFDLYEELGIGVCRPTAESGNQDCNEFDSSFARINNLANKVFASNTGAGIIPREMCKLYAESCYYSTRRQSCLNEDEVSCYDYNNEADCIGPNDHPTNDNGEKKAVDVNVEWKPKSFRPGDQNKLSKQEGDNIAETSNDYFNKGVCKFPDTVSSCVKDADDNEGNYPPGAEFKYGSNFKPRPYDCQPGEGYDTRCSVDTSPPETVVPYKEYVNTDAFFDYSVIDYDGEKELRPETGVKTYFKALATAGVNPSTYPTMHVSTGTMTFSPMSEIPEQPWTLLYFSEDDAKNLEEVKTFEFTVDTLYPDINVEVVVIPDLANHKVDLTITLKAMPLAGEQIGEQISCIKTEDVETGLYIKKDITGEYHEPTELYQDPPYETTADGVLRDEVSETYVNIDTGEANELGGGSGLIAEFRYECYDRAGNKVESKKPNIVLDADMTISDPMPNEAVKDSDETTSEIEVPISITTLKEGQCNYSSSWVKFPTTEQIPGHWKHSAVVTLAPGTEHAEYNVRCRLEGIQGLVYGTSADKIRITIDDKPPQTIPYLNDEAITFNKPEHWVGPLTMPQLKCVDIKQGHGGASIFVPHEIGCEAVHLCIGGVNGAPAEGCDPDDVNYAVSGPTVNLAVEESTTIRYYSADKLGNTERLGNTESPKEQIIKYDEDAPQIRLLEPRDSLSQALTGIDIKEGFIALVAEIDNTQGIENSIAPLDPNLFGTYYVLSYCSNNQIKNDTIYPLPALTGIVTVRKTIELPENKRYCIDLYSKDLAGNLGELDTIEVIRDSLGPKLDEAIYKQKGIINPDKVEFGFDFELHISNLLDDYPGTDSVPALKDRVSQVWVEDQFGIRYSFNTENKALWEGIIKTRLWPVDDYTLTIFANDSVGNIAKKELILSVVDTTEPYPEDFRIENIYSTDVNVLTRGKNHVVIEASESIDDNITLYFEVGEDRHDVTFTKRDFEAITWIGEVIIPEYDELKTDVGVKGDMYDINGQRYKFDQTITIDSRKFDAPKPAGAEEEPYSVQTAGVSYMPESGHTYQFTVNGIISTDTSNVEGFKQGSNTVSIRAQDNYGYYEIFTQNVSVEGEGISISSGEAAFVMNMETITENILSPIFVDMIDENIVTNMQTVAVTGNKEGASEIYVIGEDEKQYLAALDEAAFTVNVNLVGRTFTETPNTLELVFVDNAGNKKTKAITIIKDLQPPNLIDLIFGRVLA